MIPEFLREKLLEESLIAGELPSSAIPGTREHFEQTCARAATMLPERFRDTERLIGPDGRPTALMGCRAQWDPRVLIRFTKDAA